MPRIFPYQYLDGPALFSEPKIAPPYDGAVFSIISSAAEEDTTAYAPGRHYGFPISADINVVHCRATAYLNTPQGQLRRTGTAHVRFEAKAESNYILKGSIADMTATVWVENTATGARVSDKIGLTLTTEFPRLH